MSVGLFFENYIHYVGIFPPLSYHLEKNQGRIEELAELLYDDRTIFWDGTGRSGKVALRGKRNFGEDAIGKRTHFVSSGFDPRPEDGDIYIQVSGSGNRKTLIEHLEIAKDYGMITCGITRNLGGHLAKKADIVITMPGAIAGESAIKQYFNTNLKGEEKPFQELGSVFEVSGLIFIDGFSYALAQYKKNSEFRFHDLKDKLFNSLEYIGNLQYYLEYQENKINKVINAIKNSEGNVRITGFRFTADIGEMAAIRINHKIYEKGKREASFISSTEFPTIREGDILIPASGKGETYFTNWVTKQFVDRENKVFPLTYNHNSTLVKLAGEENSIIFPTSKIYKLSEDYVIREYEIGLMIILDSIALSLERSEEEMEKTHSVFG